MRKPKPLTQELLEKSALAYLERFATSRENLRRVLKRKLIRAEPDQRPGFATYIDELIEKLETLGYLNDETYADGRVAALRRHGLSARAIGMKLQAKGIARDLVTAKLEADESTDLEAAWALARRRRLGPYRRRKPAGTSGKRTWP